jgi:hypothetical protein
MNPSDARFASLFVLSNEENLVSDYDCGFAFELARAPTDSGGFA